MRTLSVREIRGQLPRLEHLLNGTGELLITRRGKPIARLLPVGGARRRPSHADLRADMPRLRTGSEAAVRADRDAR